LGDPGRRLAARQEDDPGNRAGIGQDITSAREELGAARASMLKCP
jgi:hypothetical protein